MAQRIDDHPLIGTTFISPTGPNARLPEREMRVVQVSEVVDSSIIDDGLWIDAEPVRWQKSDEFFHCTYRLDDAGCVLPV